MSDILINFLSFGILGGSGVYADFAVTYLLKEEFNFIKNLANFLGFIIAATTYCILTCLSTLSTHPEITTNFITFIIVSLVGLGLNWHLNSNYI